MYVYSREYGVRGKISNLIGLTKYRKADLGTFYSINGVEYIGLKSLNGIISSLHEGILLRVY